MRRIISRGYKKVNRAICVENFHANFYNIITACQRNYDWTVTNCEQLFNDIVGTIVNKKPHFIGTFVYRFDPVVGAPQEYVIIDGQQRITSLILFAKALYDLTDDADLKDDIRATFIKHTTGKNLKNKCRLRPNEFDRATFEKLMGDDSFDESNFSEAEKNSPMHLNYQFFRKKIAETSLTHEEFCQAIDQLNVVYILLKEENPQEIFESLNSTGLDLTQADLIRNFLFMPLLHDRQEELYKNYWLEIETLLRPTDNVENFLEQYLIAKLKSRDAYSMKVNSTNLYVVFKRYFANKCADTENCLRDMLCYAKYFSRALFDSDTKFENLSSLDKKFYELVYLLEANNAPIILMYLLDRHDKNHFDEATFISFIDALISLTMRAKICGNSGITSQFAGNVIARLNKEPTLDTNAFWRTVTFGKGRYAFPNDKDFQAALTTRKLYKAGKSAFCKYVLYSLERAEHKELPSYSDTTIEHILPQDSNDAWKKYLAAHEYTSAYEIFLNTLGNLTLTKYNGELGNKAFDLKKEIYKNSNYPGTRALADYSDWTSAQIQLRAKKLAATALTIWTLPAELKMPHRNHMLREIVRQLYALDSDIFRRASKIRQNLFSAEPTDFKIDENFYMKTGFDTETCLKTAKILVENFDRLGDTGIKNEIWFTLRQG